MPAAYPESVRLASTAGRSVLFADLLEVAEMHNARLVVSSATKHPANPVLPAGLIGRWDSMQASPWQGTVLWDAEDGVFKCWYMGIDAEEAGIQRPRTGYATSVDGIAWERPDLGICEYKGSRANNLLVDNTPRRTNGPCLKDVADPNPDRRYKLVLPDENENKEIWNSPDGIHFTREGKPCLTSARTPDGAYRWLPDPEAWFDVHQVLYDPQDPDPQRRYKCYGQISAPKRRIEAAGRAARAAWRTARTRGRGLAQSTTPSSTRTTARSFKSTSSRSSRGRATTSCSTNSGGSSRCLVRTSETCGSP